MGHPSCASSAFFYLLYKGHTRYARQLSRGEPIVRLARVETTHKVQLAYHFPLEHAEEVIPYLKVGTIQSTANALPRACRQDSLSLWGSPWNVAAGSLPGLS